MLARRTALSKPYRRDAVGLITANAATLLLLQKSVVTLEAQGIHFGDERQAWESINDDACPRIWVVDASLGHGVAARLCHKLRAHAATSSAHIVVIDAQETATSHWTDLGADGALRHPIDAEHLCALLRQALQLQAKSRVIERRERRRAISWLRTVTAHELNNPLVGVTTSLDCIASTLASDPFTADDRAAAMAMLDEGREAIAAVRDALERLTLSHSRIRPTRAVFVNIDDFHNLMHARLEPLYEHLTTEISSRSCSPGGQFDVGLMGNVVAAIAEGCRDHITGSMHMIVSIDQYKAIVMLHMEGAPNDYDPESLLEPRLAFRSGAPPNFDPGLSNVEAAFGAAGGQLFTRCSPKGWKLGFVLPLSGADSEPIG